MGCNKFEKYQLGKLVEENFLSHKKGCVLCQEQEKMDAQLMNRIKSEEKTIKAPFLWDRIEAGLKEEQKSSLTEEKRISLPKVPFFSKPILAAAAVIVLIAGLTLFIWLTGKSTPSKLLDQAALKRVEQKESEYIKAIALLEQRVQPKLSSLDLELMFLYKDRLQTIDDQIERCQEALSKNPANTHIRNYLLAAFQDKKDTLGEIMGIQNRLQNGT